MILGGGVRLDGHVCPETRALGCPRVACLCQARLSVAAGVINYAQMRRVDLDALVSGLARIEATKRVTNFKEHAGHGTCRIFISAESNSGKARWSTEVPLAHVPGVSLELDPRGSVVHTR